MYDSKMVQGMIRLAIGLHEDHTQEETPRFCQGLHYEGSNGQMIGWAGRPYLPNKYPYKSRERHPYSYSPIIIWGEPKAKEKVATWNQFYKSGKNFGRAQKECKRIFGDEGQYFDCRDPALVQLWLAAMLKNRIDLHMIVEYCNEDNGYPYWHFHFTYLT